MKLTPPAPQHPLRRMRFFVDNQDNPKFEKRARHEILRLNERMVASIRRKKPKAAEAPKTENKLPPMEGKKQAKPKKFLEKIVHRIKKASQRGN